MNSKEDKFSYNEKSEPIVTPDDIDLYAFTEDASLVIAGLDNSSTGFKIPNEMKSK